MRRYLVSQTRSSKKRRSKRISRKVFVTKKTEVTDKQKKTKKQTQQIKHNHKEKLKVKINHRYFIIKSMIYRNASIHQSVNPFEIALI